MQIHLATVYKMIIGQQYYPAHARYGPGGQSRTMCRQPIDPNDPELGQVYMSEHGNSRPKEIVWSCEYHEVSTAGLIYLLRGSTGGLMRVLQGNVRLNMNTTVS